MSTSPDPRQKHPGTYFVQDSESKDELKRLQLQSRMYTASMGGVLPEQPDPASLRRVLDVGCGTGEWLIETAKTYPSISLLVGGDVSLTFIEYARAQAEAEQLSDRMEFHVMDALRMLEFPTAFFDLVNQRAAASWLRTWDWLKLLQEYQRVTRPGGVVRITELNWTVESTSPALTHIGELLSKAAYQAGHLFTPESDSVPKELARLLSLHGFHSVQTRAYTLEYRAGTSEGQHFYEDTRIALRTLLPFLRKWTRVPDDYEAICQQALIEMQQPNFVATLGLLTAWGEAP